MYNLPHFKIADPQKIQEFMRQHPFVMLIGCNGATPVATQVPVLVEERNGEIFLKGHIMRNTDHHKAFMENGLVLCLFTGAHTYVSARWYTNPQTASTWNYMSVQAHGTLTFLPETELITILRDTTAHFEGETQSPAAFETLPEGYVQQLAKAIIGFKIAVTKLDHVFKLSQNRDAESYATIIRHLQHGHAGAQEIAAEMQTLKSNLFPAK